MRFLWSKACPKTVILQLKNNIVYDEVSTKMRGDRRSGAIWSNALWHTPKLLYNSKTTERGQYCNPWKIYIPLPFALFRSCDRGSMQRRWNTTTTTNLLSPMTTNPPLCRIKSQTCSIAFIETIPMKQVLSLPWSSFRRRAFGCLLFERLHQRNFFGFEWLAHSIFEFSMYAKFAYGV
jgi:hypothetical protein